MKLSGRTLTAWGCLAAVLAYGTLSWVAAQERAGKAPAGPFYTFTGRVLSRYGPVSGARVRVAGQDKFVLSDRQGRFRLRSPISRQGRVVVTAGKAGWFNNGIMPGYAGAVGDIFLYPVFVADDANYRFYSPLECFRCHGRVTQIWHQSKMAHTTANSRLLSLYYGTRAGGRGKGHGYRLDFPRSEGNCARCHAPSVAARPGQSWDLATILQSGSAEWEGISCEYCHKVRRVLPDSRSPSGHKAVLERRHPVRGRSILVFGPYDDVVVPPMAASYSPVFQKGVFCAACHSHFAKPKGGRPWNWRQVYKPKEWAGFGLKDGSRLPVQTTYHEWKQWQEGLPAKDPNRGKLCQTCHMNWQKRLLPYDNYVVSGMALNMWGTHRSPQNIRPHHFEGGTLSQLKTALALEVEGKIKGKRLTVKVHVSNTNGGHWVPTGETMRNIILLVSARGGNDKPLKMLAGGRLPGWAGRGDPKKGNYAGLPGAIFARVLADAAGNLNVPFWRATRIVSDNRLRPKQTVTLTYVFHLPAPDDEPSAEARLIYRPVVASLAKSMGWKVKDIPIISKAW